MASVDITDKTPVRINIPTLASLLASALVSSATTTWWISNQLMGVKDSIRSVKDNVGSDVREVKSSVEKIEYRVKEIDSQQAQFVTRIELENWTLKLQLKNNSIEVPTAPPKP